jgi:hypothetical protein
MMKIVKKAEKTGSMTRRYMRTVSEDCMAEIRAKESIADWRYCECGGCNLKYPAQPLISFSKRTLARGAEVPPGILY